MFISIHIFVYLPTCLRMYMHMMSTGGDGAHKGAGGGLEGAVGQDERGQVVCSGSGAGGCGFGAKFGGLGPCATGFLSFALALSSEFCLVRFCFDSHLSLTRLVFFLFYILFVFCFAWMRISCCHVSLHVSWCIHTSR